ncbi:MAG: hypothetical protein FWG67_03195 [Defluviitaleaceae bacterium]|nr:hypothetical protein [Defluviitaleaceae bacterium]
MNFEIIKLNDNQISDIENRLEIYDNHYMSEKLSGDINTGVMYEGELIAGACGCISAFKIFYVSTVYVDEAFKKKGLVVC